MMTVEVKKICGVHSFDLAFIGFSMKVVPERKESREVRKTKTSRKNVSDNFDLQTKVPARSQGPVACDVYRETAIREL